MHHHLLSLFISLLFAIHATTHKRQELHLIINICIITLHLIHQYCRELIDKTCITSYVRDYGMQRQIIFNSSSTTWTWFLRLVKHGHNNYVSFCLDVNLRLSWSFFCFQENSLTIWLFRIFFQWCKHTSRLNIIMFLNYSVCRKKTSSASIFERFWCI